MEIHKPKSIDEQYFIKTKSVEHIRSGVDYAIANQEILHVISDAGFGKSPVNYF